jgi:amino acid adenylation domain-containing protein
LPFERLVEALQPVRTLSYTPLFQVMFALQNASVSNLELPELTLSPLANNNETSKYDLTLFVEEGEGGLAGSVEYNTDLFDASTITRMMTHFQKLLAGVVDDPDQRLSKLSLLEEAEQQQLLVTWNQTQSGHPASGCIHELFEAQAERTPQAIAVVFDEQRLTYQELNQQANELAHYLQSLGVGSETLVGVCLERSLEMVVGLLAILKAGGAYVPLDPHYPPERVAFMLADTQAPLLLTQERLLPGLPDHDAQVVCLDREWKTMVASQSTENPASGVMSANLAYIIYTSGSTGQPKGVAIEHGNAVALLEWARDAFTLEELGGVLASTSICFDLSVFELFLPLSCGGKIILVENVLHLPGLPLAEAVTLINTVPSAMAELVAVKGIPASVRTVNLAGETLKNTLAQRIYEQETVQRLFNLYGPSEDTTYSTFTLVEKESRSEPSIGRPVANTQAYILDKNWQPTPIGVPGELYLGGAGVARGYLNRPALTAERFVPDPFSDRPGAHLYKTGDLGRYRPDGSIVFLGRMDHQVKIRGFRIELGEIEATLIKHEAIRDGVVVAREDAAGDKSLVAYFAPAGLPGPSPSELRRFLKQKLPDYMIPTTFLELEALPLTPNGKVDRKALPVPDQSRLELQEVFVAPRNVLELELARIWEDILGTRPIGVRDNFFNLGGHSLSAVRLMSRIQKWSGQQLPLSILFQGATVERLATILRQQTTSLPSSPLVAIQPAGSKHPFFCVHPGGGGVMCYFGLARKVDLDRPFYGFQAPGLSGEQEPYTRIEEMASAYIERLRTVQAAGPYLLGGWSMGGVVAFEMAQQLQVAGEAVGLLALMDTRVPRLNGETAINDTSLLFSFAQDIGLSADDFNLSPDDFQQLRGDEQLNYVLKQARISNKLSMDIELGEIHRLFDVFKTNVRAMLNYQPQSYPGQIALFKASEQLTGNGMSEDFGWGNVASGGIEVYMVPGSHFTMLGEPHDQVLAERLRVCLDKVGVDKIGVDKKGESK